MSEERRERLRLMIYLYREGVTAAAIGDALGITKQGVLGQLARAGVPRRRVGATGGRGMARPVRLHQVTTLFDAGMLITDICKRLGLSRQYVRELLAEACRSWRPIDDRRRKDAPEHRAPNPSQPRQKGG